MRADLQRAHAAAKLRGTLEEALQCPLLRRCLEITAHALVAVPCLDHLPEASEPASLSQRHPKPNAAPRPDFKRVCAADLD